VRIREQVKFDEQSMRIRHSNLLAMAQFLSTETEPKLYYKPWEMLPDEAERIKQQVADTEAQIEQEVEEFKQLHKSNSQQEQSSETLKEQTKEKATGEHQVESSSVPTVDAVTDSTNLQNSVQKSHSSLHERGPSDENEEIVVETEEDTVIF